MKRLSWKYLAGLIDGEGCIDVQISKGVYVRPRLRIGMSVVADQLRPMLENLMPGTTTFSYRRQENPAWQDSWSISWDGYRRCNKILRNVVKHLILKKEQARFVLWLEEHIKGKQVSTEVRDAIREELKLMKRDPHRLSEQAQQRIVEMLQSD